MFKILLAMKIAYFKDKKTVFKITIVNLFAKNMLSICFSIRFETNCFYRFVIIYILTASFLEVCKYYSLVKNIKKCKEHPSSNCLLILFTNNNF
ncbi:MAG: hypothetical protein EAZ08_07580 [Cytophagales bacterium]|nr:MAG: hypothetical protein EAZ08_07580 [Cytophagales bacterium]